MAYKVLALTKDGNLTYCTVPPEMRGKVGRCNHVAHQGQDQSVEEFVASINERIAVEEAPDMDQYKAIVSLVKETKKSFNENPDWESVIKDEIPNYFVVGKGDSYEEARLESVDQVKTVNEAGDPVVKLTGHYEFRGEKYAVDLGEVPEVQEDGTVVVNGTKFRVLPVLSQFKSGVVMYSDSFALRKKDGDLAAYVSLKEPDVVYIRGQRVPLEEVSKYLRGEDSSLTVVQKKDLDEIDPVAFERFPQLKEGDLKYLIDNHEPDDPADITYRKVLTYKDQVKQELEKQFRRMGVTFRTNLAKRAALESKGQLDEETKAKLPLFYQKNNTENIKSEILNRSNTQLAEDLNPLAAMSQSHKVSLTGPGGFNKDKAPVGLRKVHPSHKGVVDSLDVSSGKNVGLTIALSNADVDSRGFITPKQTPAGSVSCVSDFIPYKNHTEPVRASMAVAHMKQAVPLVGGEDPKSTGDAKADAAWQKLKGCKLGVNLNVAYLPTEGTFEDGYVISESAARRMTRVETNKYSIKDHSSRPSLGMKVTRGQYVGGERVKYNGVVKSVTDDSFEVESEFKMGVGDKLAGRHGNKGVVTKVLPDSEMPFIKRPDGSYVKADVLISPTSVVGRGNLSQIYETNDGDFDRVSEVRLPNGKVVKATAGTQFIMRLNHIAEKKLTSYADSARYGEAQGMRFGEMESILMTTSPERLEVLNYLRTQETKETRQRFEHLMKAIGVEIKGLDDIVSKG